MRHERFQILLQESAPTKSFASHQDVIYEYQRWQPIIEWGSTPGHFTIADKGKWSRFDNDTIVWGDFEHIAHKVPEGWEVHKPWSTVGRPRPLRQTRSPLHFHDTASFVVSLSCGLLTGMYLISSPLGNAMDVDGWAYATNFEYLDWFPKQRKGNKSFAFP